MAVAGLIARIALLLLTGWLAGLGVDAEIVALIRDNAELLALLTAAIWAVWYWAARRFGWTR
jgi:hypothetical protein